MASDMIALNLPTTTNDVDFFILDFLNSSATFICFDGIFDSLKERPDRSSETLLLAVADLWMPFLIVWLVDIPG